MRRIVRLMLLAWIGLAGLALEARAQGTVSAPGGVAAGRDIRESTINIGIPPDQVAVITEALRREQKLTDEQRQTIAKLEGNLGVSGGALRTFFRTLGENEVPPERQEAKLVEIAERYKQLLAQVSAAPGDDPEVAKLKSGAKAALDAGQLERADDLLAQVQAVQDAALERKQLEAAATAAQRGEIALTRLRYRDAAEHFAAAARRVCSQSADTLPDAAVKVSDSEIRQVRYASWRLGMNLGLAADLSNFRAGEVAPLMKEAETLAVALHVPTPILPKIQHFASALPEFAVYLESDLQCVAARLTSQYGPSYGYLYKFGAVIGHATLYRAQGIASFVPQIQDYGQLAGIPQELWLPMTQGANMRKEVLADVQRLESYIKADP